MDESNCYNSVLEASNFEVIHAIGGIL